MFRYIIIIWDVNDAFDCDVATKMRHQLLDPLAGWRPILDQPGMYVAYIHHEFSSDSAIPVGDFRGVILGKIFRSPEPAYSGRAIPIRHMSRSESRRLFGQRAVR